jgi:hypothetical protein
MKQFRSDKFAFSGGGFRAAKTPLPSVASGNGIANQDAFVPQGDCFAVKNCRSATASTGVGVSGNIIEIT